MRLAMPVESATLALVERQRILRPLREQVPRLRARATTSRVYSAPAGGRRAQIIAKRWRVTSAPDARSGRRSGRDRHGGAARANRFAAAADGHALIRRHLIDLVLPAAMRHRPARPVAARVRAALDQIDCRLSEPGAQPGDGGTRPAYRAAPSATPAREVRNFMHRAGQRAAAATGGGAPLRHGQTPDL